MVRVWLEKEILNLPGTSPPIDGETGQNYPRNDIDRSTGRIGRGNICTVGEIVMPTDVLNS